MKLSSDGKIGPYRLIENLGVVPRGKAYRAIDERIDRLVILKTIPRSVIDRVPGPEVGISWSEAVAEARRLTRMDRQGMVSLYEIVDDEDGLALSFAPSEGRTLRALLSARDGTEKGPEKGAEKGTAPSDIDRPTLARWAIELLDLLTEAHGQEILHRHIGADSVRIDEDGHVQLTGFGLTQLEFDRSQVEPPELGNGQELTPAADVYQAGSLLLKVAAGWLDDADPLLAILRKATREEPDERYLDAGEMQLALREALAKPVPASTVYIPIPKALPKKKENAPAPAAEASPPSELANEIPNEMPGKVRPPVPSPPTRPGTASYTATKPAGASLRALSAVAAALVLLAGAMVLWNWIGKPSEANGPYSDPLPLSSPQAENANIRTTAEQSRRAAAPVPVGPRISPVRSAAELPENPPEVQLELTRARDLILEGDDEGAGYRLEELLALPDVPNPLPVFDALGSLYLRTGRPRRAQATIEQALAILPNTERHYQLGLSRAAQGDTEGALAALRDALDLDPTSEHVRTVISYLEVGQ